MSEPSNKGMKLTKLSAAWLPEWTCRLMPAPVNSIGRGHRFAAYPRCSTDPEARELKEGTSWRPAIVRRRRVTPPAAAARAAPPRQSNQRFFASGEGTEQSEPLRAGRSPRQSRGIWPPETGLGSQVSRASVVPRGSDARGRRHGSVLAMKGFAASRNGSAAQPLRITAGGAPRLHLRGGSNQGESGAGIIVGSGVVVSCGNGTGLPSNKGMKLTKGGWSGVERWSAAVATGSLVQSNRGSGAHPSQLIPGVRRTEAGELKEGTSWRAAIVKDGVSRRLQ